MAELKLWELIEKNWVKLRVLSVDYWNVYTLFNIENSNIVVFKVNEDNTKNIIIKLSDNYNTKNHSIYVSWNQVEVKDRKTFNIIKIFDLKWNEIKEKDYIDWKELKIDLDEIFDLKENNTNTNPQNKEEPKEVDFDEKAHELFKSLYSRGLFKG